MISTPVVNVHADAKIGKNTIIEPFATIYGDVVIGNDCWIGPNAVIMDGARIGNNVKIYPGAVISAPPQDLKFEGEYTTTEIGDNTVIREHCSIHRGTKDRMKTVIGSDCLLMGYVHIAHDCEVGNHCILANYAALSGHITLEDWVILEGRTGAQQFVRIGAHAFVAAHSFIRKNIPPFVRAAREPLSFAAVNAIGLRRRGMTDDTIKVIEDIYRQLYVLNNSISAGVKAIEADIPDCPEKEQILKFIKESDKGIIRGPF